MTFSFWDERIKLEYNTIVVFPHNYFLHFFIIFKKHPKYNDNNL